MVSFSETLTTRTYFKGNTPKFLPEYGLGTEKRLSAHKSPNRRQYRTNVTIVPHALSIGAKINDIR